MKIASKVVISMRMAKLNSQYNGEDRQGSPGVNWYMVSKASQPQSEW